MKRQVIKGYPWPEEKHSIAIRKAVIERWDVISSSILYLTNRQLQGLASVRRNMPII